MMSSKAAKFLSHLAGVIGEKFAKGTIIEKL